MFNVVFTVLNVFLSGTGTDTEALWETVVNFIPKLLDLGTVYLSAVMSNPLYAIGLAIPLLGLGGWVVSLFMPGKRRKR